MISTQVPTFTTVEEQRAKVHAFIQENIDHAYRKIDLKERINYTNLMTYVTLMGHRWSLQNLLDLQRGTLASIRDTYASLSDRTAQSGLRTAPTVDGRSPQVVRLYDENYKLTKLDEWDNIKNEIDSRLEVINAMTDLLELPLTPGEGETFQDRVGAKEYD